jgi:hypothetical protein
MNLHLHTLLKLHINNVRPQLHADALTAETAPHLTQDTAIQFNSTARGATDKGKSRCYSLKARNEWLIFAKLVFWTSSIFWLLIKSTLSRGVVNLRLPASSISAVCQGAVPNQFNQPFYRTSGK